MRRYLPIALLLLSPTLKAVEQIVPAPSPVSQEAPTPSDLEEVEKAEQVVEEAEDGTPPPVQLLDNAHETIAGQLVDLADRLDSFFGEQRADDELNRSALRVSYGQILRSEKRARERVEVRLNLRLPNLEDKFRFSLRKNEDAKDDVTAPLTPEEKRLREEQEERKRRKKREEAEKEPWRFRADAGVVVGIPPQAFARGRLRKNWHPGKYIPRFIEELGYYTDRGLVDHTTFNVDRRLREKLLFRFENDKTWVILDKEVDTSHGPTLQHKTSEDDAFSYSAKGSTRVDGPWYLNNWRAAVSYRRNLRGQWLYGEITPAVDFPKSEGFRRAYSILLRLETLFGTR